MVFGMPPRVPHEAQDWPKEMRYYGILRQSVRDGTVPYFVSRPIQETRKFLAIPEVVWSPQIVLLRWLDTDAFLFVNVVLLQALGTLGLLALRRRYGLSMAPFLLMWLLLAFNGHITAHLAVGHSMWGGYFLIPFFLLSILDLVDRAPAPRWPIHVGLVLAAMLLQGSYHVFVWCVLLLLLLAVVHPDRRATAIALALAWSAGLGLVRLVPAAVILLGRHPQTFETGYPSVGDLAAGLVRIRDATFPRRGGGSMGGLQWWEYDAYVGGVALAWILVAGARGLMSRRRLAAPLALMAVLSMGSLYRPINTLGVPLLASQRVTSRLLVVPLGMLIVIAAIATEGWVRTGRRRAAVVWWIVLVTGASLVAHSRVWTMAEIGRLSPAPPHARDLEIEIVAPPLDGDKDALYVSSVRWSAGASAFVLALAVWRWRRAGRPSPYPTPAARERGAPSTQDAVD
jgi:hypothetical protein